MAARALLASALTWGCSDAPTRPVSYYGITKQAAERYALVTGERPDADLSVTALRMLNVYGERQSLTNP